MDTPTKRCSRGDKCLNPLGCELPATPEYFHRHRGSKDGLAWMCKVCAIASVRQWELDNPEQSRKNKRKAKQDWRKREKIKTIAGSPSERRKINLVEAFGGQCQRCGYSRSIRALHFHHITPGTRKDSGHVSYTEVKQHPELFMLVCANCHAELHEALAERVMVTTHCLACGKEFVTQAHRALKGRGKYCSKQCQSDARGEKASTLESIAKRFWKKVLKTDRCWIWTGQMMNETPCLSIRKETGGYTLRSASKISFRIAFGHNPEGNLYRTCHNIRCVNPDHLTLKQ